MPGKEETVSQKVEPVKPKKTSEILLELLKSPIFYKLIVFESLNTELFIKFINEYYRTETSEKFNGIYINVLSSDQMNEIFKDDKQTIATILKTNFSGLYLEKYNLLSDHYDETKGIFHILELDHYIKTNKNFKNYIDDCDFVHENWLYLNLDPIIFTELINIVDKAAADKALANNSPSKTKNYESLLDNTIQQLKINNNKDVLTFLKLRNDEELHEKYNNRFKIFLNKKANKLGLYYKNDDESYYDKIPDHERVEFGEMYKYKSDKYSKPEFILDSSYDYKYLFGPFTQIFDPSLTNKEIANKMDTIKNSLEKGNDVFIIGYGASGAGKTSTLVYLSTTQENGIVVNICNQLSNKFNKIELSSIELYGAVGQDKPQVKRSPAQDSLKKTYSFVLNKDNEFVVEDEAGFIHTNNHPQVIKDQVIKEKKFEHGEPIGNVIIHMIDNDRLIYGTTNNPKSSRSHALIFLKLMFKDTPSNDKDHVYLIIGDFAGVENQFECDKPEVIQKFSEINVETRNRNGNTTKKIYAYKKADFLPVSGGGKTKKNKKIKAGSTQVGNSNETVKTSKPDNENKQVSTVEAPPNPEPQPQNQILTKKVIIDLEQLYIYDFNKEILDYSEQWTGDQDKKDLFEKILFIYKKHSNFTKFDGSVLKLLEEFESADKTKKEKDAKRKEFETKIQEVKNILLKLLPLIKPTSFTIDKTMQPKMMGEIETINTQIIDLLGIDKENIKKNIGTIQPIDVSKEKIIIFLKSKETIIPSELTVFFSDLITKLDNSNKLFFTKIIEKIENLYIFYSIIFALPVYIQLNKPMQEETDQENLFKKIQPLTKDDIADAKTIITKIDELYKTSQANKKILENQCSIRLVEGNFINNSLTDLRTIIKGIISKKNEGIVIPNFIGDCFNKYFKDDYFKTDKISEKKSEIMDEIMKEIFGLNPEQSKLDTFKNNLIISIFCVFNISRGANNPPPTHYIDINKLKYIFKIDKKNKQITPELKTEITATINLLKEIGKNFTSQQIFKDIELFSKTYTDPKATKKLIDEQNKKYIPMIEKFNDSIDNFNAPSAVGTLDFLDSLAKYNTIDNVCRIDDNFLKLISSDPKLDIIKSNNMKELYIENANKNNNNTFQNKIEKRKKNNESKTTRQKQIENALKKSKPKSATQGKPPASSEANASRQAIPLEEKANTEVNTREKAPKTGEPIPPADAKDSGQTMPPADAKDSGQTMPPADAKDSGQTIPPADAKDPKASDAKIGEANRREANIGVVMPPAEANAPIRTEATTAKETEKPLPQEELIAQAENYDDVAFDACLTLGEMYKDTDIDKAIKYYEKAAPLRENGYKNLVSLYLQKTDEPYLTEYNIYYKLGLMYEYGRGVILDVDKAEYYYKLSKTGAAYRRLGLIDIKKHPNNKSYLNAKNLFIEAFKLKDASASLIMIMLLRKIKTSEDNEEKKKKIDEFIKMFLEDGKKKFILDIIYITPSDNIKTKIIEIIKEHYTNIADITKKAENEYEDSQFILSMIYANSIDTKYDNDQAKYWRKKALDNEYSLAKLDSLY